MSSSFAARGTAESIETGDIFQPKFDSDGLIPAIVTDAATGAVLMFAYMNQDAVAKTLSSGTGHFWSRSRQKLWKKGEDSGNVLTVREIRTDCDQDVLWLAVSVQGSGVACHTGAASCFYRTVIGAPGQPGGARLAHAALQDLNVKK